MTNQKTLEEKLQELKNLVSQLWYVKAGDIVESRLHNLIVDCLYKIEEILEQLKPIVEELWQRVMIPIPIREEIYIGSIAFNIPLKSPNIGETVSISSIKAEEPVDMNTEVSISTA